MNFNPEDNPLSLMTGGTHFKPINDGDSVIFLADWLEEVKRGNFVDYDGYLATEGLRSSERIQPSDAENYEFPIWATHIVFYNKQKYEN